MKPLASPRFWELHQALPKEAQEAARKSFALLKSDARHPSLYLKRIGVGERYRALGIDVDGGILWVWIGTHAD